jgi:type II secretory pathway pseudopilin PulG
MSSHRDDPAASGPGVAGRPFGFTLVEVLVVFVIVAALIGLLLPAVQGARESARLLACRNRVQQLAKAVLHHEIALRHYPSGGWGPNWLSVAERGSDSGQPGGWTYSVLPYVESTDVRNVIADVDASTATNAYLLLVASPLEIFSCPSRRPARVVALAAPGSYRTPFTSTLAVQQGTLTDYAANGGSTATCPPISILERALSFVSSDTKVTFCHVPPGNAGNFQTQSLAISATEQGHGDHDGDHIGPCFTCDDDMTGIASDPQSLAQGDSWRAIQPLGRLVLPDSGIPDLQDGILHRMSRITTTSVRDGTSNTYLLGEKYVAADRYAAGSDAGDNRVMFAGYSSNNVRWAYDPPAQDEQGVSRPNVFGSGHRGGWNVALADGSTRTVAFTIDLDVHRGLAARADGRGGLPGD